MNAKGTVKSIKPETVRMVNACRLWLRALHIEDLMTDAGTIDGDLFMAVRVRVSHNITCDVKYYMVQR